jgi:plasmid stabilization system protein ParE
LVEKAHSIGDFPEKGQVVPEVGDPSLRQIVHGKYRIIYKFIPNPPTVFVIRFWHGARGEPEIAGLF